MKKINLLLITIFIYAVLGCSVKIYEEIESFFPVEGKSLNISSQYAGRNAYLIKCNESKDDIDGNKTGSAYMPYARRGSFEQEETVSAAFKQCHCGFLESALEEAYTLLEESDEHFFINGKAENIKKNYYSSNAIGEKRDFFLQYSKGFLKKTASLKTVGKHCYIWYVDDIEQISNSNGKIIHNNFELKDSSFEEIKDIFDSIYQKEIDIFGNHNYEAANNRITSNADDKIFIILFDIAGDAASDPNMGTFGYFNPVDLFYNNKNNSNECKAVYLDSYFFHKCKGIIKSTLVHEFQHLLNFVNKTLINKQKYDVWFTEMLSMICEDMFQSVMNISDNDSPKNRLYNFASNHSLGFTKWRRGSNVLTSYANAYAFGAYLARNYGGASLIKSIAQNPYTNQEAVSEALKVNGYKETFSTAFYKSAQVLINTDNSNSALASLYKEASGKGFTFSKINMAHYSPAILKEKQVQLGTYGISVNFLGKIRNNGSVINISFPDADGIKMFVVLN